MLASMIRKKHFIFLNVKFAIFQGTVRTIQDFSLLALLTPPSGWPFEKAANCTAVGSRNIGQCAEKQ